MNVSYEGMTVYVLEKEKSYRYIDGIWAEENVIGIVFADTLPSAKKEYADYTATRFTAIERCSSSIVTDTEDQYERIESESNAGNKYAYAKFDMAETASADKVIIDMAVRIPGSRYLIGIGDMALRPGASSKSTYDKTGCAIHFGTKDGRNFLVNGTARSAANAAIGEWADLHIEIDLKHKWLKYSISKDGAVLYNALKESFSDTSVNSVTGIDAYTWTETAVEFGDISVTALYGAKENMLYAVSASDPDKRDVYAYRDNEPVMLGRYGASYVFDTTPKSNSTNPVTSKGIYTAISKCITKEGKQTIKIPFSAAENDTPLTLESNNNTGCYIGLKPFTEDTGYYGVTDEGDPVYYLDENGTDKILNFRDVNVTVDNIYAHGEGKSDNAAHEIASQATITAAVDDNSAELIADWNDHKFALAAGDASHIEGSNCLALGKNSHAEGNGTIAEKSSAHAEGTGSHAKGKYSHAGGLETTASGNESFAHGYRVRATGNGSVALGYNSEDFTDNNASEFSAIAIGHDTKASAYCSAAIGDHANALNDNAIAIGNGVRTAGNSQVVLGKYNKEDGGKLLIVGNGGSGSSRSNGYTLDWNGNAWYAGTVEAAGIILKSSTAGSTRKFRITVDDSGALSAERVE